MEIKTSTVKQVQPNGTWDGKFGVMYKYEIEMTNGDAGQYMSKSKEQDKFKQGAVVEYQFFAGDFPKIKPHFEKTYNEKFGDGGKSWNPNTGTVTNSRTGEVRETDTQLQIIRQSSIRTAAEFCKGNCTIDQLIDNAQIIFDWCKTGERKTNNTNDKQDLPF